MLCAYKDQLDWPFTANFVKVQSNFAYSGRGATIMRKLSVGYIVDDGCQPRLIYDLIEKSKSAEHYSIDYLIVQTFAEDEKNLF